MGGIKYEKLVLSSVAISFCIFRVAFFPYVLFEGGLTIGTHPSVA